MYVYIHILIISRFYVYNVNHSISASYGYGSSLKINKFFDEAAHNYWYIQYKYFVALFS